MAAFIGGGVGSVGRVGGNNANQPEIEPIEPFYPVEPNPELMTAPWHTKPLAVKTASGIIFGFSNGAQVQDPPDPEVTIPNFSVRTVTDTGEPVDSRIMLRNGNQYEKLNIHFTCVPYVFKNGIHAGKLIVVTLPHGGPNTVVSPWNGRMYFRHNPNGSDIAGLLPSFRNGNIEFLSSTGGQTVNYVSFQETVGGVLTGAVINDALDPKQSVRMFEVTDPSVVPSTFYRRIYTITSATQLYFTSVPDASNEDYTFDVIYPLPSYSNTSIKIGWRNLKKTGPNAGCVLTGVDSGNIVVHGTGTIYDTTGDEMLQWENAPTIYNPTLTSSFTRVHDVNEFGAFASRAVAFTEWQSLGSANRTHNVIYCPIGQDRESTWTKVTGLPPNRARPWVIGTTQDRGLRFLPPRGSEDMRVMVVAYDSTEVASRIEIYGITAGVATLVGTTPYVANVIPMIGFVNPGAAVDRLQGLIYQGSDFGENPSYDYVIQPALTVKYDLPINLTAPVISGTPSSGIALTPAPGTWAGIPLPTITYQWEVSNDGVTGWTAITGATNASYTPVAEDVGKFLRRGDVATNEIGSIPVVYSNVSVAVTAGFSPGDLGDFLFFRISGGNGALTTTSGLVDSWTCDTSEGGTAGGSFTASGTSRPRLVSSPFNGIDFDTASPPDGMIGNSVVAGFLNNRGWWLVMNRVSRQATIGATPRSPWSWSTSDSASSNRLSLRFLANTNIADSAVRAGLGTETISLAGRFVNDPDPTVYEYMQLVNFDINGSTNRLYVDGVIQPAPAVEPTAVAASDPASSLSMLLGRQVAVAPATFPGVIGDFLILCGDGDPPSSGDLANIRAWYQARQS